MQALLIICFRYQEELELKWAILPLSSMIDNEILKSKLKKQLKSLKLTTEQEEIVIKELNYLSNLLIDIYIKETKNGQHQTA